MTSSSRSQPRRSHVIGVAALSNPEQLTGSASAPLQTAHWTFHFDGRQLLRPQLALLLLHGDSDADVPAKVAQRLHAKAIEADEASTIAVLTGVGHLFIEHPLERGAKAALDKVFNTSGPIKLMTGHKAKGLEFDTVYHLDPWIIKDERGDQEKNLRYVIQTRAKEAYYEIDSKGIQ